MFRVARWALAMGLFASSANAIESGVGISWDDCGAAGRGNRSFACDRNEGWDTAHQLYLSFVLPAGMDSVAAVQAELRFTTSWGGGTVWEPGGPLPPWWQLRNEASIGQLNQCRDRALSLSWTPPPAGPAACVDIWQGRGAAGGIGRYTMGWGGEGTAKLNMVVGVPPGQEFRLDPGVEYFAFRLLIDSRKTVGSPSCPGCQTRVSILPEEVEVCGRPYACSRLGSRIRWDFVIWQDAPTPVQRHTWGGIKALYR